MSHVARTVAIRLLAVASAAAVMPAAHAVALVTTDASAVAMFQAGGSVLGFDDLPPNGGGGSAGNTGVPIQPASQLSSQFISMGVRFSSDGGPVGIVSVKGLGNQADARSAFNLLGGSNGGGPLPVLDYFRPIVLNFVLADGSTASTTNRVGAWNDPTGSLIRLSVFDMNGSLLESAEAAQGNFIGITHAGIASASFTYVATQSQAGFSLDDVSFGPVSGVPVPPAAWMLGAGLLALGLQRHRTRRLPR
ncbi:MAG: hypothetical protein EOP39_07510 [Rubrivivax sp.]|nr:MAG: hypothetical protein EOP39_07510 [Rubrivivax sp.]